MTGLLPIVGNFEGASVVGIRYRHGGDSSANHVYVDGHASGATTESLINSNLATAY